MGADNSWSGRVEITPPLTWAEIKVSPAVADVRLDLREEDGPDGMITTAVAVVPTRSSNSWGEGTAADLQAVIDAHPEHEFTGYLQVDWDPALGGDVAERFVVQDRRVAKTVPHLVWPGEEVLPPLELVFDGMDPVAAPGVRVLEFTDWDPEQGGCRRRSGDPSRLVVNRHGLLTIRPIGGGV